MKNTKYGDESVFNRLALRAYILYNLVRKDIDKLYFLNNIGLSTLRKIQHYRKLYHTSLVKLLYLCYMT